MNRDYSNIESLKLTDLEVGEEYWVHNGAWSFKVFAKDETNITIRIHDGSGPSASGSKRVIPLDSTAPLIITKRRNE